MKGYINIFKNNFTSTVCNSNFEYIGGFVYTKENKAIEAGKYIKGYIATVEIIIPEGIINGE